MVKTTRHLVEETNALIGYTQSDEITLLWMVDTHKTEMFMGGIDELKVWNYAIEEELIELNYDYGVELMSQEWFKNPEKQEHFCRGGEHTECPLFNICNSYNQWTYNRNST